MTSTIILAGSPSSDSRTLRLARHVEKRLTALSTATSLLELRTLPAEDLLHARATSAALSEALERVAQASGVVVATPIYKASYSGLTKLFLDVLPQYGLRGKVVLPLATGGSAAHVLALDYALRPVLQSMDPAQIVAGLFVLEDQLRTHAQGELELAEELETRLERSLLAYRAALRAQSHAS